MPFVTKTKCVSDGNHIREPSDWDLRDTSSWFTQLPRAGSAGHPTAIQLMSVHFIPFIVHSLSGRFYFGYAPFLAAVEALSILGLTPHLILKAKPIAKEQRFNYTTFSLRVKWSPREGSDLRLAV